MIKHWQRHLKSGKNVKRTTLCRMCRRRCYRRKDIERYVEKIGLIHPFLGKKRLKRASYEIGFGKRFIYWDQNGKKIDRAVKGTDIISLPANSIGFVELESEFLLPNYIAARLDLRIQHVHRGLLVGTGPLVDPGFRGNLLVPLHNLTTDAYEIPADEGFIWVEFTKTSYRRDLEGIKEEDKKSLDALLTEWESAKEPEKT